jgi:2,3-bisphosphoglycerate-dependent phosphoglycerate mutase
MRLHLLRHAESRPTPDVPDPLWRLSQTGARQAQALVPVLERLDPDWTYASPYRRAVATVRPFVQSTGARMRLHPGLRERRLTEAFLDDADAQARASWADFTWARPDGEPNALAQQRFVRTVLRTVRRHAGRRVLFSTHGTVIGLFLNAIDPSFGVDGWSSLQMPDLVRIDLDNHGTLRDARWQRIDLPSSARRR